MYTRVLAILAGLLVSGIGEGVAGDDAADVAARIGQQLRAPGRDEYDAAKDAGRRPAETVNFTGIGTGMTVLDMVAGAGYNTEILSAAVGPDGLVYAQNPHFVIRLINGARHDAMLGRLANNRLANVRYIVVDAKDMPFEGEIDAAMWGLNMHDIYNARGEAGTLEYLRAIHRALKPGGVLAVSDHVGEAGNDNAKLHRIEPAIITDMLGKAGFVVEATSGVMGNPEDDHTRSVYADGLRYQTDRILVRARKPADAR